MTIVAYIMATLLVLSFLAGIIIPSYQISRALFRFFLGDYYNLNWLRKELEPGYRAPLARHFRFYRQLSPRAKKSFERRVQKFIDQKDFSPKGGLPDVTDEMKALIAASAIQITFGLPSIYLQHFRQIYVFPESYY
ncbi:MAG: zinc-dependent peptidase, partial [Cyclobacteriaceae bacterium]|nr:zinc-dependent peptidase [Cyclobacteriaceae bacterium]